MSTAKPKIKEIDPSISLLILKGITSEVEAGKIEVVACEKINYSGSTTIIINFKDTPR